MKPLVNPHLHYSYGLLYGTKTYILNDLQVTQNYAARLIEKLNYAVRLIEKVKQQKHLPMVENSYYTLAVRSSKNYI